MRVGVIFGKEERSYDTTVEGDVLLAEEEHDAARVEMLVRRVVEQADWLEAHLLPGRDEPLTTFETDLNKELTHAGCMGSLVQAGRTRCGRR